MAAEWPLVGRDEELALVEERLRDGGAMVVAGLAGVGKSRLAQEALRRAETKGWTPRRVVASRSAAALPFGAFAPLLPDLDQASDTRYTFLRRAALAVTGEGDKVLLAVDDAQHLDDASATLVHQLAEEGNVALLLTIRSGEVVPDAISLLWKDGLADRLELQSLSRSEVETLTSAVLGGVVDGAVHQYLWSASVGNPLYLRELVNGGVDAGTIFREGPIWRLADARPTPPRLVELVENRIEVDDDERVVLELLAFAETVGLEDLEAAASPAVIDRLERRDLVVVSTDGRRRPVRLAHPIYGEVIRNRTSAARTRMIQRRIADGIEARGALRRADALRVVTLRLDSDGHAAPDLLERAVGEAFLAYDVELTERISRAGIESGGGPGFVRLLGETLRWQGRHDEAEALLGGVDPRTIEDERHRGLLVMTRAECLFRGLGQRDKALAVLEEGETLVTADDIRDEMQALRGVFYGLSGEAGKALELLTPLVAPDVAPRPHLAAATGLSPVLTMVGRADDAIAVSERAFTLGSQLGPQPALADPGVHMVARCLALAYSGRLAEAEAPARVGYEWSLATAILVGQSWFAMVLGLVHLNSGRLQTALRYFREAAAGFRDLGEPGLLRWCLAGVAQASAAASDVAAARAALLELESVEDTPIRLADVEVERARAWVAAAEGHRDRAWATLDAAASWCRDRGLFGLEPFALHDLVRLGTPARAARRLEELRHEVQGPAVGARADHAAALVAGDGPALDAVSETFEEQGALLLAAEAAAQGSVAHSRAQQDRLATASRHRADELRSRCEGASTAALEDAAGSAVAPLTRREREIASFAAGGMPSRDIAAQLFLSVRTVENHLQRVYSKLGVSNRAELARVLQTRK